MLLGCLAKPHAVAETCLGEFSVGSDAMLEEELVAKYGSGWSESPQFPYRCYSAPDQGLEVRLVIYPGDDHKVLSVFASRARICTEVEGPRETFPRFKTSEGLAIGDTREKVIRLYGEPTQELGRSRGDAVLDPFGLKPISDEIGDTILRFRPTSHGQSLLFEVYLKEGVVSSLFLSSYP